MELGGRNKGRETNRKAHGDEEVRAEVMAVCMGGDGGEERAQSRQNLKIKAVGWVIGKDMC